MTMAHRQAEPRQAPAHRRQDRDRASVASSSVPVRAPGTIQLDERRDRGDLAAHGSVHRYGRKRHHRHEVRKGQPLMRLYSPAIASAAADYLADRSGCMSDARSLRGAQPASLEPGRARSRCIDELERTRQVPLTFTWTAPRDGIVLERNVSPEGMRVMPGDVLFRIADHSAVWAMVDVAERDLGAVAEGQSVMVRARSYPGPDLHRKSRAGLSAPQSGDPHGAGAHRASQPRPCSCCPTCMRRPRSTPAAASRSWPCRTAR